ncbi:hypothetical protein ANTQUA_LOCUS10116 [Anthophora quadrimaculata]
MHTCIPTDHRRSSSPSFSLLFYLFFSSFTSSTVPRGCIDAMSSCDTVTVKGAHPAKEKGTSEEKQRGIN